MLNVQEKEKKLNAKIKTLENFLYNAILCWFADMGDEYDGLEDEAFVRRVCAETGMTRSKYERLIRVSPHTRDFSHELGDTI